MLCLSFFLEVKKNVGQERVREEESLGNRLDALLITYIVFLVLPTVSMI